MPKKRKPTKRRKSPTTKPLPQSLTVFAGPQQVERTAEDRLRDWFDHKLNQLRERVDRLETSSIGEFSALIDQLRHQVRTVENTELARVAEINRFARSASDAARSRVEDVISGASAKFVSHDYLHSWISRINEELDAIRSQLPTPDTTPPDTTTQTPTS
jgi:hypothetical protein